ncbi:MAG TPA: CPBP family intramembrane glutamic endopeptidase [Acidisarcina sp.]
MAAPYLLRRASIPNMAGILMFPIMLLGPSIAGIVMTRLADGRKGLTDLRTRLFSVRVAPRYYAILLVPPILVLTVLKGLETFVSPMYAPNFFLIGVLFGVPAGFLEEIGWTGYALPKMVARGNGFAASVLLGVVWSLWHLPVINFLGAASPHGAYWFRFFLAFALAMTAMRVLIAWLHAHTRSILLAQLMHVSSTGVLVIFGAPRVNAVQEAVWYATYGLALWIVVGVMVRFFGINSWSGDLQQSELVATR